MAGTAAGGAQASPSAMTPGRGRASGIYGAIITAAVLAAAGEQLPTRALAASVLITLLVYWIAEEYAELLGEQVTGHLPTWAYVRAALARTWPMVSASYLPLLALVLARLAGASAPAAANVALGAAIVLLTFHGWSAGRASELRGWQLAGTTSIAAALGLVMVALKDLVILHLH
ncbi:MAG: hypothetical protein ABI903_03120 [Actinomycetota bacterium]